MKEPSQAETPSSARRTGMSAGTPRHPQENSRAAATQPLSSAQQKAAAEIRYRRLFEASRDGVLLLDSQTLRIIDANPFMTVLLGYSYDELMGKELWEVGLLKDDNAKRAAMQQLERESYIRYEDLPLRSKTGETREVEFLTSVYQENGVSVIECNIRDISERKRVERDRERLTGQLLENAQQFRHLVGSVKDYAIYTLGRDGRVATWNAGAERIKGWKAEEIVGRFFSVFFTPEDAAAGRPKSELEIASREGCSKEQGWRARKDGSTFWGDVNLTAVRDEHGELTGFAVVTRDSTERRHADEALRATLADLEQMSSSLVHDIRAPLRAMQGFAQLMLGECVGCRAGEGLEYLRRIQTACGHLDQLITDALDYNKVARQELPLAPVDLAGLIREMVDTYPNLQPMVADIEIGLQELVVMGNKSLLTQCFGNLLSNAVKFVAPGVKPKVRVRAEGGGDAVRVWVEDNGIGIPKEAHEQIFKMFQRMHQDEYPGTGIGLATVRRAVERMGGQVGLESEPDAGSRFWVDLKPAISNGQSPAEASRSA